MIKNPFSGLKQFLALFLFTAFSLTSLQATAPSSASGWTFFITITEGRFGYGKSGQMLLSISDSGSEFRIVSLSNLADNTGTCTYQASGTEGKITINNVVMTFSFNDERHGSYTLIRDGDIVNGYQRGRFSAAGGTGPDSFANKLIDFNGSRADVRGVSVNYQLSSRVGTYSILYETGASPSNPYREERINASMMRVHFNDNILGTGQNHLVFNTPTSGLFFYKIGSGKAYEVGTFFMQVAAGPEITRPPQDQMTEHGGTAVFSVEATGTQPMAYQWFQDLVPIPGANQATYVVDPAIHDGNQGVSGYYVRVSNRFGSVESEEVLLETLCPATFSKSFAWFDYRGGTSQVNVINMGCSWKITEKAKWINPIEDSEGSAILSFKVDRNTNAAPRTGFMRIGTEIFKVAQQGTYTPTDLRGKMLRIDGDIGIEGFPTNAPYFFAMDRGITNQFYFSTFDGVNPEPFPYSYQRINVTNALVSLSPEETLHLTFSNFTSGIYSLTNTNNNAIYEGLFTLSPRRGDLTADGHPYLIWQNAGGEVRLSYTLGAYSTNIIVQTNTAARLIGFNDFTRDGNLESVYFYRTPRVLVGFTDSTNFAFRGGAKINSDWRIVSTEDISGDRHPDILFQNHDGRLAYWQIGPATNYFSRADTVRDGRPAHTNWIAVAVADMDGDRQQDIVLWNRLTGQAAVWLFMNGDFVRAEMLCGGDKPGIRWRLKAVADMNHDGHNDLLWQHFNGNVRIWYLNGLQKIAEENITDPAPDPAWILTGPK
ncbi:MAG: VCBS repeat-containing protein [Verrucomicrobia bacterium]|nr:VCBS repeat-containing protein [Verrucomicrobiota bacterium]